MNKEEKRIKQREADKRYREKNRVKLSAKQKIADEKRSAKRKKYKYEYNKQYRENNRVKVRSYARIYSNENYERDRKRKIEAKKRYRKTHPLKGKQEKKKQRDTLSSGYINELVKQRGIPVNRSIEFNKTLRIKIMVNRLLAKRNKQTK